MESNDTKLLQAINTVNITTAQRFARLETKCANRSRDDSKRMNEEDIKHLKNEKSKWFDVVMQALVISILGFLLVQAGFK